MNPRYWLHLVGKPNHIGLMLAFIVLTFRTVSGQLRRRAKSKRRIRRAIRTT